MVEDVFNFIYLDLKLLRTGPGVISYHVNVAVRILMFVELPGLVLTGPSGYLVSITNKDHKPGVDDAVQRQKQ